MPSDQGSGRWLRWLGRCLLAGSAWSLWGCGSVDVRPVAGSAWKLETHASVPDPVRQALLDAPDCCRSLQDMPFQDLSQGGKRDASIGLQSPAHRFASGKSFFTAFRVAGLPRPARLELSSFRSPEPGAVLQKLMLDTQQTVLQPTVLILNSAFEVVRTVDAVEPRSACTHDWGQPAFQVSFLLSGSPQEEAYLVLVTSAGSLAREGQTVCGLVRHGMSPVGELKLQTRILPIADMPVHAALPVHWYPGTRRQDDVGFWQFVAAETHLLALGNQALHILQPHGPDYRLLTSIPYERIAQTSPVVGRGQVLRSLSLAALDADPAGGAAPKHHTFQTAGWGSDGDTPLENVAQFLVSRQGTGTATSTVAWRVLADAPTLQVRGFAHSKVGDAALAGGLLTAMPCALCQTGACPPEVLLPCAGLFGVGALLGGATGVVRELLSGHAETEAQRITISPQAAGSAALRPVELTRCLGVEMERTQTTPWREGGLSARSVLDDGAGAAGQAPRAGDYRSDVILREVALVRQRGDAAATRPDHWQLHMEAQLRLTEVSSGKSVNRRVEWVGAPHPAGLWAQPGSNLWAESAAQACAQLARQLVDTAEQAWRGH